MDAFAGLEFLADTLENQHVRVDRHADGQHNTGDARQGEGGVEVAHDAHQNEQVEYQREVGHRTGEPIVNQHEDRHRDHTVNGGLGSTLHRVRAEGGFHAHFLDDFQGRLERVKQGVGDGRGFLHGEIAGDLAVTGDLFLQNWGGHELTIEDDGHLPPDVGPAKAAHSDSAFAVE